LTHNVEAILGRAVTSTQAFVFRHADLFRPEVD
jgi:hypothetical protein